MTGSSPDCRRFIAPQVEFDGLRSVALRSGGARFVDLAYANAWDGPTDKVRDALRSAVDRDERLALQYTPYGGATVARRLAAQALAKKTDVKLGFRNMVLTPGAMGALSIVLRLLGERGGNVVIPVPTWLDHPLYAATHGLSVRFVPLREPTFELNFDALEAAIDRDTRAVILTQPGNPTGAIHSRADLEMLDRLLSERDAILISDECHRDYAYETTCASAISHVKRCVVVYSYGKRLLIQGQRLGYAAVSPALGESFADELSLRARALGICTPTALMQQALGSLEELELDVEPIRVRRERIRAALTEAGVGVSPSPATMFLYLRVRGGDDWEATRTLAGRGVLVCPAALFHHTGWVRISAGATDEMLDRSVDVLKEVLA